MNVYKATSLVVAISVIGSLVRVSVFPDTGSDQGAIHDESSLVLEEESRFVEQELDDIESPFTRETVLKLNSIVGRSLSAINEFDQVRSTAGVADNHDPSRLLAVYEELSAKASAAQVDMGQESSRLVSSDEHYNEEILAAMVYFVSQVDSEIREEADALRLGQHTVSN